MLVYTGFDGKPLLFTSPETVISCNRLSEVKQAFREMESALANGCHLAGFLSYEAGYAFEEILYTDKSFGFPLVRMGCYRKPLRSAGDILNTTGRYSLKDMKVSVPFEDYEKRINRIRDYIVAGDVYQITYCIKTKFSFSGDERALYSALCRSHPMPYPAYIEDDAFRILSLSPEMFIRKKRGVIRTKPMKGTWFRGGSPLSDLIARFSLKYDPKNRAENLMITDLLRNDLGRIGTDVRVRKLFEVDGYRTLFQMTSTIEADVEPSIPVYDVFRALFPSGSVTGAPKIRSMEVIREIEQEERHIYTGAIGYITPEREMFFNVPIRTMLIKGSRGEMGVGGGIIWDSTARGEWAEGLLKAKFMVDMARQG